MLKEGSLKIIGVKIQNQPNLVQSQLWFVIFIRGSSCHNQRDHKTGGTLHLVISKIKLIFNLRPPLVCANI